MNWIFAVGMWFAVGLNLLISHNHYIATGAYPTSYFIIDILSVVVAAAATLIAALCTDDD